MEQNSFFHRTAPNYIIDKRDRQMQNQFCESKSLKFLWSMKSKTSPSPPFHFFDKFHQSLDKLKMTTTRYYLNIEFVFLVLADHPPQPPPPPTPNLWADTNNKGFKSLNAMQFSKTHESCKKLWKLQKRLRKSRDGHCFWKRAFKNVSSFKNLFNLHFDLARSLLLL